MLSAEPQRCAAGSGPRPPRGLDPNALGLLYGPRGFGPSPRSSSLPSLRDPGAHLQAGSAKGRGRETSPQGDSDHRRHFGSDVQRHPVTPRSRSAGVPPSTAARSQRLPKTR